jgi:L-methionine (R)-S-oxide reductase
MTAPLSLSENIRNILLLGNFRLKNAIFIYLRTTMPDYTILSRQVMALCQGETDCVSLMATMASEVHSHHPLSDWTGFYRVVAPELLKIGPYQGGHGCLVIPFSKGVCGAVASSREPLIVPNVAHFENHIACSSTTQSELVLPVFNGKNQLLGVFDLDSNSLDAFNLYDVKGLSAILLHVFKDAQGYAF